MEILENKALLVKVRKPDRYTAVIKDSAYIGEIETGVHEIAVKWTYENTLALTKLGIKKVPSSILKEYKWTGRFSPMAHQKDTAAFIINNPKCFVFNEQGVGKTASAAWAADYLLNIGKINRVLVVCPLSIMKAAWQRDLFQVLPHRSVGIAHGSAKTRRTVIQGDYDFVVINFDGVEIVMDEIKKAKFDLIIVDEANGLKNTQTRRWKTFKQLVTEDQRLVLMTGTPASQSPEDAYGLAKLVNPSNVPQFFSGWKDLVMQKVSTFKWVPRPRANDIVYRALQPAIRYTKEECLDLPDIMYETREVPLTSQQEKYYEILKKQFLFEAAGEEVSAVNAAAKLNKLLQISCITGDTNVLSDSGWKRLDSISINDLIWDGKEWVTHSGLIYQGMKEVITLDGVRMTRDHKVLTESGWYTAEEISNGGQSKKFNRTKVRIPNSDQKGGDYTEHSNPMCSMGMPMQLRNDSNSSKSVSTSQTQDSSAELRMSSWKSDPQTIIRTSIQYLVRYETQMFESTRQRLQKLWSARDNRMRPMGKFIRTILDGYAKFVSGWADNRQNRYQQGLFTSELSMGYITGAGQQHTKQPLYSDSNGSTNNSKCCKSIWNKKGDPSRKDCSVQMGCGKSIDDTSEAVYDILNCGPRNRFVVQNGEGNPIIVHNCGAVYADDGSVLQFDVSNRLSELEAVIDESLQKVIVFAPFTHTIDAIESYLQKKRISCAVINGAVSANKRAAIINQFQTTPDPRVIIIQPQAAAHGITLTAANTVVWFGPTSSVETYLQANARAHRKGQNHKVTIIMIQGSAAEAKMYDMLNGKVDTHQKLVDLYADVLNL